MALLWAWLPSEDGTHGATPGFRYSGINRDSPGLSLGSGIHPLFKDTFYNVEMRPTGSLLFLAPDNTDSVLYKLRNVFS